MTHEPRGEARTEGHEHEEEPRRGAVFWDGLRSSMGRTPVWLLTWFVLTLLTLPAVLPWLDWYQAAFEHRVQPGSQIAWLGHDFRIDHAGAMAALDDATALTGVILVFVAWLCGVFFAGGWLQIFLERTSGHSLRRFFYGGSRYFFRFFRFLVVTLLVLALWSWVCYELPWKELVLGRWMQIAPADFDGLETLESERTALYLRWGQHGLFLLLFGLTSVWADYSRARLALHDASSALWSGLCTFFLMLRRPIRTLRPMLLIFLTQVLVVAIAVGLHDWIEADLGPDSSWLRVLALFGVAQVLPLWWAGIARGARYCATVRVLREISQRPRPEPWHSSIGGPGGPRYPLGGDEYGVSL